MSGPIAAPSMAGGRVYSVAEYHHMIESGQLTKYDKIELIEGRLVKKMSINPPHGGSVYRLQKQLLRLLPGSWAIRIQSSVTL